MLNLPRLAVQQLGDLARSHLPLPGARSAPAASTARWSAAEAADWSARTGWLVGANFTPSTAGNQLELWQADTFDPATIDRELGWAAGLGMNSIRLFLHDLVWSADGEAFLDRVEQVLEMADRHGIGVMPVLFDGIWDTHPRLGVQRQPTPHLHNSTWVQGPGADIVGSPERWDGLRSYVDAVLGRFGQDPRVVVWDLFNEPDSPNPAYAKTDVAHKRARTGELVDRIFDWAQAADPSQPLTVGVYLAPAGHAERVSRTARSSIERSDVISFHSYAPDPALRRTITALAAHGRPLLCTEWLGRPRSPVAQLATFAELGVGAYCWGLVDGRTQTRYPWTSWVRRPADDAPWFHELLHVDGTPYDEAEAGAFRRITTEAKAPPGVAADTAAGVASNDDADDPAADEG